MKTNNSGGLVIPTPGANIIRVSELLTYRQCRRKWDLQYNQKLDRVDRKAGAREYGTLFHEVMKAYYLAIKGGKSHSDAQGDAWVAWVLLSNDPAMAYEEDQIELFQNMIAYYFDCFDPYTDGWTILEVEKRYYAKVPHTNTYLSTQLDLVFRKKNYGVVSLDHKTWGTWLNFDQVQHSTQLTAHLWILKQNGIEVREAAYNMVKKQVPHSPNVLKNGTLSKAQNQSTTKSLYVKKIKELGFEISDYQEFLDNFEEPAFHCYEAVQRSDKHLDNFEKNLIPEVREMMSKKTYLGYNDSKECTYCDFAVLCTAMNNDAHDWKSIKKNDYKVVELGNAPVLVKGKV